MIDENRVRIQNRINELETLKTYHQDVIQMEVINKELRELYIQRANLPPEEIQSFTICLATRTVFESGEHKLIKKDGKWLFYTGSESQYVTPIFDNNGKIVAIKRMVCDSSTNGIPQIHTHKVYIDEPNPDVKLVPPIKQEPLTFTKTWICSNGHENYIDLVNCRICREEKPIPKEEPKKNKKWYE